MDNPEFPSGICHDRYSQMVITIVFTKVLNHYIAPLTKVEQKCWDILEVMSMNGCEKACATNVHQLLPGEVAFYHKNFATRPLQVYVHVATYF